MLSSITPLGERSRGARWHRTTTAYVLASALSGALLGWLLATIGHAVRLARLEPAGWLILAVCCVVGVGLERKLFDLRLPTTRRQVDQAWMQLLRGWVYGAGFGAQLGLGVTTIVYSSAIYVLLAFELLAAGPALGALVGFVFGALRGATILLGAHVHDTASLMRLHARLEASRRPTIGALQATQLVVAGALVVLAINGVA
jgi:hypothetical protein